MNLTQLMGSIHDVDSHEMIPAQAWGEHFGEVGERAGELIQRPGRAAAEEEAAAAGSADTGSTDTGASKFYASFGLLAGSPHGDDIDITEDTVWRRVGWESQPSRAPGAMDMQRRLEVLDTIGVKRQFVFPGFGLMGLVLLGSSDETLRDRFSVPGEQFDPAPIRALGRNIIDTNRDWMVDQQAAVDRDRMRFVAPLACDVTLDELLAEAELLISSGVMAVGMPQAILPAGLSPAHRDLDPLWTLFEEADVPVCLHALSEQFTNQLWDRGVPEFAPVPMDEPSTEFVESINPYLVASLHLSVQNYLTVLTLGGVFERHPRLRVGVFEVGANWFGPLADHLDIWSAGIKRVKQALSMRPSEYLARNVRVSPFFFEPVDSYINRYGYEDNYCYGSDYPHKEGGSDPVNRFLKRLAPLGDSVVEKFFVSNAEWLMPA